MKKRLAIVIFTLALLMALAAPAFAMKQKMYVKKDCYAYQEPDKHSRVTMELHVGHDLTCTDYEDGYYECRYGWVQAKYLSDTCPHKWGKWVVIKEPTCTKKGTRERTCKYCGETDRESIKKTGHSWGKWKVTKEATCSVQGTRKRTCKNCGEVETEKFYAEHQYGSWKVTKEPTCTAAGEKTFTCKIDKTHVKTEAIPAKSHDLEKVERVEPTKDKDGNIEYYVCKECHKLFKDKDGKTEIKQEDTVLKYATPTPAPTKAPTAPGGNAAGSNPKTGDETNIALYVAILTVCGAAAIAVVSKKKNNG